MTSTGVLIVNFEHISHICSGDSILSFEQVNAGWQTTIVPII